MPVKILLVAIMVKARNLGVVMLFDSDERGTKEMERL